MINDLEKQFFDIFGIEPMPYCCYHDCNCPINDVGKFNSKCPKQAVTKECDARIIQKPQITDRILLELICILNENTTLDETYYQGASTVKELKRLVLKDLIKTKDNFDTIHQVRTLFEEG